MRLMGIDYGARRVGVALTDETGSMAFPHATLKNSGALIDDIADLIEKESVKIVVIGQSKNLNGEDNPIQEAIDIFVKELKEKANIEVESELEYYSTQESLHIQGRTKGINASAATIILNSYINRKKNKT